MSIANNINSMYTVQPGDTLYAIAARFGSSVEAIAQMNHLYPPVTDPHLLFPGQILVIPSAATYRPLTFYVVTPGDNLYTIAERFSTSVDLLMRINPRLRDPNRIFPGQSILVPARVYIVEPSDSLYHIATQFGVPSDVMIRANRQRPGFSQDVIWPGYALVIPLSH